MKEFNVIRKLGVKKIYSMDRRRQEGKSHFLCLLAVEDRGTEPYIMKERKYKESWRKRDREGYLRESADTEMLL